MNLVPLFEEALEFQDYNGTVLSDGKVAVYYIGRTRLADIYEDVAAEYPAENPRILNNLGMGPVYVNPAFDYEMVVFDAYGSELFSVKKYLASKGEHSTANVVVTPSESIAVSAWTVGDVQIYMPYLTGQLGKVYEGIDPIVVNNQVDKISANHVPLGVQDPLYFVQDDEEACIIGFSGETLPEGTMNESAFGYEDGKITGYNGSGFSAGLNYEAGSYVDIDGNTINVTGLQPAGNYQSAGDYVVHDELSSYATQDWVNEQGFLTAVPSEYVTENTLQSGLSSKLDSSSFASVSGDFLTAHQSLDGLMSADLLEISDNKITGYNGTAFAGQGGGVTGDFELSAGSGISIVDYPLEQKTVISVTAQGGNPEVEQAVIDNSATWNTVNNKLDTTAFSDVSGTFLTAHQSLDGYATESWVTSQGYLTAETDWSDTITAASANAYNEATAAIPTGIATEDWVTGQGYITNDAITGKQDITGMTAYQPAGDYLTTGDSANFATTGDIEDLVSAISETYQPITAMTAYQEAGNYLSANALDNLSGNWETVTAKLDTTAFSDVSGTFLTAHQDISNKLDTTAFSDVSGSFLTAVPDTYLQNTDLSTEDGKVTAISGIPLSAGGDVPEGVMVESGLEYNAVNEISGYNGSAIAQYGAEKQLIVHDDTLCHLSNSAQYALGVNLSAVAQLLGVDETVLWTGTTGTDIRTTAFSINEPFSSFKRIRFEGMQFGNSSPIYEITTPTANDNISVLFSYFTLSIDGNPYQIRGASYSSNNGIDYTVYKEKFLYWSNTSLTAVGGSTTQGPNIQRIVGIGRKS